VISLSSGSMSCSCARQNLLDKHLNHILTVVILKRINEHWEASPPLGWAICQHGPVSRDLLGEKMWKARELGIRLWLSGELWVLKPPQPSIWVRLEEEGGMTSLSFSLSLYAFSNLSHEIHPKYMITQVLSPLLFCIWLIFLSAFLIYFCMSCFSLNLLFSECPLKYLSPTIELAVSSLRTSYIMCETDVFSRRRKTHKPYSDWLTDLSWVGEKL